jgi:hypothetical protein
MNPSIPMIRTSSAPAEDGNPTFVLSMNTYWKHPVAFRRRELTDGAQFCTKQSSRATGYEHDGMASYFNCNLQRNGLSVAH